MLIENFELIWVSVHCTDSELSFIQRQHELFSDTSEEHSMPGAVMDCLQFDHRARHKAEPLVVLCCLDIDRFKKTVRDNDSELSGPM